MIFKGSRYANVVTYQTANADGQTVTALKQGLPRISGENTPRNAGHHH